ncbi:hypothetical protein EKO27_g6750 [Xylaria grammica]|uniref:Uncharacterized protein n=1 Tax=Xylaria grammica TaxID=363999 RepID=A0A439D1L6_9PEZI|nr:hypothetical protein EKO27_g6750 [Xylaria grammica]
MTPQSNPSESEIYRLDSKESSPSHHSDDCVLVQEDPPVNQEMPLQELDADATDLGGATATSQAPYASYASTCTTPECMEADEDYDYKSERFSAEGAREDSIMLHDAEDTDSVSNEAKARKFEAEQNVRKLKEALLGWRRALKARMDRRKGTPPRRS